jgi:hypothetical protein
MERETGCNSWQRKVGGAIPFAKEGDLFGNVISV